MSQPDTFIRTERPPSTAIARAFAALASIALLASPAAADSAGAKRILKSMSDYMASQKNLSADFDAGLDVVTTEGQKIEFTASGSTALSRPNKLRATRRGAYSDIELVFDGETTTIIDRGDNEYAQVKAAGTVDKLVDQLRLKYGVELPAADLLMSNSYDELIKDVVDAKHMGQGVIGGRDCEHLAFRNQDTDWQLWVRTGNQPLPCKLVITSKTVKGLPEYTVVFRDWKTEPAREGTFAFTPPSGAKVVAPGELKNISDLPAQAAAKEGGSP
jgi:hypothetical protein